MWIIYEVNYELLKEKRKEKNLTLEDMAKILGLGSRTAYYYKEIGENAFLDSDIAIIVPLLGITFDEFFKKKKF